jgi:hypothetical protein
MGMGPPERRAPRNSPSQQDDASRPAKSGEGWRDHLARAAGALASAVPKAPETREQVAEHAKLRLIQLLAGQREQALQPIPAFEAAAEEFWFQQLYGLETWLDTERTPDTRSRVIQTKHSLSEAVNRLSELAPLEVRRLTLCSRIDSYGCIQEYSQEHQFSPGDELLLYAEIENVTWESTPKGYRSSLRSSYLIVDSRRHQVAQRSFAETQEYCQQPRRDFFFGGKLLLPVNIQPGKHTLQLTVEDGQSGKFGQATVELTVQAVGN